MVTVDDGADGTRDPGADTGAAGSAVPRPRDGAPMGAGTPGDQQLSAGRRARGRRVAGYPTSRQGLFDTPPRGVRVASVPGVLARGRAAEPAATDLRVGEPSSGEAEPATGSPPPDGGGARAAARTAATGAVRPEGRRQARTEEPRSSRRVGFPRRIQLDDVAWWCVLAGFGSAFAVIAAFFPDLLPLAAAYLLVLVGLVLAPPLYLLMDFAVLGVIVAVAILLSERDVQILPTFELVMIGAIVIGCARHRDRSGVSGKIGGVGEADTVLIDLRDRLRIRTAMPVLPPVWRLEAELRQAGGDRFGGDFVVAATPEPGRLDVVLVDVSGKGRTAGGRALLLQGAFAALLDSVPRDRFLVAANQHVLRHGDDESFATAVHLSLDLVSGHFVVAAAGHPPAAQHHAGSGRWSLKEPEQGPPLGVLPDVEYPVVRGRLESGDSLMLYTDGMVEGEGIDVVRGIDRLLGFAEPVLLRGGGRHEGGRDGGRRGAERIMESIDSTGDDRGLVLLRRQ